MNKNTYLEVQDGVGTEDILGMALDSYPKCSMYELFTY